MFGTTTRAAMPLWIRGTAGVGMLAVLAACGGSDNPPQASAPLACDDSLKTAFQPDAQTTVVAVKAFKKGDALLLDGAATPRTPTASNDVCMVKLRVGPGSVGPVGAPSTSAGIGIEIWLPARSAWNNRVHALGGGGWQGGDAASATSIYSDAAASIAGTEGAVSSTTDTGHTVSDGSFAMKPDGTVNEALWADFASRGIHEQAVKTKALATAYYGSAPKYSYWEGGSTGGRQGLSLAQNHADDFDGIVALFPAINWTRFITSELYPQVVYQRDLGGAPLTTGQLDLVSNAAIGACDMVGGQHLGYIVDPSRCAYDPLQDASVLCTADGGANATANCVSRPQAQAINKMWYGMTADGSAPDPALDNGWSQASPSALMGDGNHRWFGITRGTNLSWLANPAFEFTIASDMVALSLQNAAIAGPGFLNATGNGQSQWKQLTYAELSNAYDRGVALQPQFGGIDTHNPDLTAFRNRGGKILTWHGLADELIVPQGTVNYYERVAARMGGLDSVQSFYKLYMVPGQGHGSPNGTANPAALIPHVAEGQMYALMTDWVEKGIAPAQVTLQATQDGVTRSMPICAYPRKITFVAGDPAAASSYTCS